MKLCPVVLAGGSGTRLWPLSREHYPKQLLPLHGEGTLLQETVVRLDGLEEVDGQGPSDAPKVLAPRVVCSEEQRFLIAEQLRAIGREDAHILLEPVPRNTAPALTFAALALEEGEDTVIIVMPADHVILDREAFYRAILRAAEVALHGGIATFGIVPDQPQTGYGYIRKGKPLGGAGGEEAFSLAAFVEKPDQETAVGYLETGNYFWNSGMFVLRPATWLRAMRTFQPRMLKACGQAFVNAREDGIFLHLDRTSLEDCPSDSIDYAVMEKLAGSEAGDTGIQAAVIPLSAGWSDVGAWSALMDIRETDSAGNVTHGDVLAIDSHDSLLLSEHRLVAAVGVDNLIVVETPDAVLVARKDRAQDVKKVVEWLKGEDRAESREHRRVYRPWGNYESLDTGERFQVKRITVNPGQAISLQMHHHRAEHWIVVSGTARITRGEEEFLLTENQSTYIPVGTTHRLENPGTLPLEIIEVQSGSYLGEDDIVRFEDRYNRD